MKNSNDHKSRLYIISHAYPYKNSHEVTFLSPEIEVLKELFDEIYLCPCFITNDAYEDIINTDNIHLDEDIARATKSKWRKIGILGNLMLYPQFWRGLFGDSSIFFSRNKLREYVTYYLVFVIVRNWFKKKVEILGSQLSNTLFYTYWFEAETNALASIKKKHPALHIVTRAHGIDVYGDRTKLGYKVERTYFINQLDKIFVVSGKGAEHLRSEYPAVSGKIILQPLGTAGGSKVKEYVYKPFTIRIISCSHIVSVKRLHLLVTALAAFSASFPEYRVYWTHIGDGPLGKNIRNLAKEKFGGLPNLEYHFLGQTAPAEVRDHYANNSYDVFVNVSSSEGIPVSIMEAQYYSIPVLATAVGGNPEIVSERVGLLLDKDFLPEEFSNKLKMLISNKERYLEMRDNSRNNWERNFNVAINHCKFGKQLLELIRNK